MDNLDISVIILTYNEEIHIRRCIENVYPLVKDIFIIDSFSIDKTLQIAKEYEKVSILQNKWENNYAKQFNWGLEHAPIQTKWVIRLDADEYLTDELIQELYDKMCSLPDDVSAISLSLQRKFLGRTITKGTSDIRLVRIFKYKKAYIETRWMDEHIQIREGRVVDFTGKFVDDNLNNLSWWTNKHVGYAIRDAVDLLDIELNLFDKENSSDAGNLEKKAKYKRQLKYRYARMPLFWRSFFYFMYRYILKGGFLDGKEGFLWHFLQGWWFKTLADAKVFEIKRICGTDKLKIKKHLRDVYGLDL
ncbi:glycosyltransferase family 2 protein [Parabacteroides sp.]